MTEVKYRIFNSKINKEDVISIYKKFIKNDKRFNDFVDDELISVEEGYLIYSSIYGNINDLDYLVVSDKRQIVGKINVECEFISKDFLLNGLKIDLDKEEVLDIEELNIFNKESIKKDKELFLKRILEKAEVSIYKRHNVKNKGVDVVPIKEFTLLRNEYYLEKVFFVHYRVKEKRKDLVSLLSGVNNKFYYINHIYSEEYKAFMKKYKNPVTYIPLFLKDLYYEISFDVYLNTIKELEFIKEDELYKKIKNNIDYNDHPKYLDYLYKGIFYFRNKSFLNKYPLGQSNDLRRYLLDLFLTLSFNPISGLKLADYVKLGLGEKGDLKEFLRVLSKSYGLGNLEAKKRLFEHYLEPKYYNEYYLKRYS